MDELVDKTGMSYPLRRFPGQSYEDILESDVISPPAFYREGPNPEVGVEPVATSRYYDPEFFRQEVDYVWPRVWQWACREEDIPEIGDHVVFDIVGYSFIIVRSAENEIKALANSCLHRGRQLVECDGSMAAFRCPFHGMAWNVDGSLKENPFEWDMPQWKDNALDLPEVRVEFWGGFVFINMDAEAPPLDDVLGPIAEHFERYDFENRYKAVHVSKKIRANWKATSEAFMETHHVYGTHPQAVVFTADINGQYDIWNDYVGRQFSAHAISSPHLGDRTPPVSEQEVFNAFFGIEGEPDADMTVPDGMTARAFTAQTLRRMLAADTGYDYSEFPDADFTDSLLYNVFPNLSFWGGMAQNVVYRFRPDGLDPEATIMDILILKPVPKEGPRPAPAEVHHLGFDEPVTNAADTMGLKLAEVFDQDAVNLKFVQSGMRASRTGYIEFTAYQEARIRLNHQMLDRMIAEGEAE